MEDENAVSLMIAALSEIRACPNCATRIRFGDMDCPHCGFDLEDGQRDWAARLVNQLRGGGESD